MQSVDGGDLLFEGGGGQDPFPSPPASTLPLCPQPFAMLSSFARPLSSDDTFHFPNCDFSTGLFCPANEGGHGLSCFAATGAFFSLPRPARPYPLSFGLFGFIVASKCQDWARSLLLLRAHLLPSAPLVRHRNIISIDPFPWASSNPRRSGCGPLSPGWVLSPGSAPALPFPLAPPAPGYFALHK